MEFRVNRGNTKTGKDAYVINLPPIISCRVNAPCASICYAMKAYRMYPTVKTCYDNNLMAWSLDRLGTVNAIADQLPKDEKITVRLFASGDFIDQGFFHAVCILAILRPKAIFYGYTKQYEIVNAGMTALNGFIPNNLKLIFSEWDGLPMENPYNFPVARVILKSDNLLTFAEKLASGHLCGCELSCMKCGFCWSMSSGDAVLFNQH